MSFGGNNSNRIPLPQQEPLGVDINKTPTNAQARPIPYFAGIRRLGPTYISQAFNVSADPVEQEIEKGDSIVSGHNYYFSWASLFALGPVDGLSKLYVDDVVAWDSGAAAFADSYTATVEGRGIARIYWGKPTQGVDSLLATLAAANDNGVIEYHTAYRGVCYIVFDDWFAGYQRTQAPKVEGVFYRYPDVEGLLASPNVQGDANIPHCILDLVTNKSFGPGIPIEKFNLTSFDDAAATLAGECIGISPLLTRAQSIPQTIKAWLSYARAGLYPDGNGQMALKLIRSVTKGAGVPLFNELNLSEPPTIKPSGYLDTTNRTSITFTNRDRDFKEDSITRIDQGNFQVTGNNNGQVLDRGDITRLSMASHVCASESRIGAVPLTTGTVKAPWRVVRDEGLAVGGVFRLSWDHLGIEFLYCRVTEIRRPAMGAVTCDVEFEVDRTYLAELVVPAQDDVLFTDIILTPEVAPNQAAIEMFFDPSSENYQPESLLLIERPNAPTSAMTVSRRRPSGSYSQQRSLGTFAIRGILDQDLLEGNVINQTGFLVTLYGVDSSLDSTLTLSDASEAIWLGFVGGEIISIYNPTLVAPGQYRVKAIRARFDSTQTDHDSGDTIWLVPRASLPLYPEKTQRGEVLTYKVQPLIGRSGPAIESVSSISVTHRGRKQTPITPLNFRTTTNGFYSSRVPDVTFEWSAAKLRAGSIFDAWEGGLPNPPETLIQILAESTDYVHAQILVASGVESYSYSNASLIADLGSELTFRARICHCEGGFKSAWSETITIEKI
jgi:hypothetical protein